MNVHPCSNPERGPPAITVRNRDPSIVAQLYIFSRSRKYLIRLKVLAKYGNNDVRTQAQTELQRLAAYPLNGPAAWETLKETP